jgi:hypothetical protein
VSYYFNNNDKKLIPMRRTNYLIGAQSMSQPQVVPSSAPAPYYGGLMNSNPTQYSRIGGHTVSKQQQQPKTTMKGTLERNQ